MSSVIRVNTINSRSGLSTVTFDNSGAGVEVAGIVTATSFSGTSSGNPTLTNGSNNRVITATGSNALTGEVALTFDGATLTVNGTSTDTPLILTSTNANGSHMRFQKDGANKHFIGCGGGFSLGDVDDLSFRTVDNIIFGVGTSEKVRIDSSGRVLIGDTTGNKIGDSALQVYTSDRKHPAIRTNSPNANGYPILSDAYKADESQVNIGISYSSASLVLSSGCKVSDSSDDAYLSSQDTYSTRPCALRIDTDGSLSFHTTETNATTTTDSAVSITEVFQIDRVGNIYQRITNRYMYFGASNQLKIGIVSSDPVIDAISGHLQLKKNGSTVCIVRDDHLQMYGDIKMGQGKGINFYNYGSGVDSNKLDDYEEGSVNLTLVGQYGGSISYSYRTGRYVKIGSLVHLTGDIRLSGSWSGNSGNVYIELPFTSYSSGGTVGNGIVAEWNLGNSNWDSLMLQVDNNAANARITSHSGSNNNTSHLQTGELGNGRYLKFGVTYHTHL